MSLTLDQVVTAARDRHSAFHRTRIPNGVLARFLTDYQNELVRKAAQRERHYLAQSLAIALDVDAANDPGTVGAGTSGGLPADADDGSVAVVQESAGALVEISDDVVVVVAERVATSATGTTITSTGAGRTTNEDANRLIRVTSGPGKGEIRTISSNTTDTWTVSAAFTTTPTTASLFEVIAATVETDEDMGVVTAVPALSERRGYLVRLNASGVPTIDYTQPLTVNVDRGVPLPSVAAILGGTVRYTDEDPGPLTITTYERRFNPPDFPAVYMAGEELFLVGEESDWQDVSGLELRYTPIAPTFAALTDYFLVPDAARPALVAKAADFMAMRVAGMEGIAIAPEVYEARAREAERDYLNSLRISRRSRFSVMAEGDY